MRLAPASSAECAHYCVAGSSLHGVIQFNLSAEQVRGEGGVGERQFAVEAFSSCHPYLFCFPGNEITDGLAEEAGQ